MITEPDDHPPLFLRTHVWKLPPDQVCVLSQVPRYKTSQTHFTWTLSLTMSPESRIVGIGKFLIDLIDGSSSTCMDHHIINQH